MRFGTWRGVASALALTVTIATGWNGSAFAGGFGHTIPREVEAVDINTGGPFFAPPVPYGHYAKDKHAYLATAGGLLHGGLAKLHGAGHGLGGCGLGGCGLKHGGQGCGDAGCGNAGCGDATGGCHGFGFSKRGHGGKLFGDCGGKACGGNACGGGEFVSAGPMVVQPSAQMPLVSPQTTLVSPQAGIPVASCGTSGCLLKLRHFHRRGNGCDQCGGGGCGICKGGVQGLSSGDLCGNCHGNGCGGCGGLGLLNKGLCGGCGGRGCGACLGLLGLPKSLVAKALHKGDIKWFVGPGGPVPLTPGYVPYVVTTRSPRDFFAFPPFNENVP